MGTDAKNKAQIIAALVTARSAIDSALLAMSEEAAPPAPAEEPEPAPATPADEACKHERRKAFKTFGAKEHWVCEDCGYEYRR